MVRRTPISNVAPGEVNTFIKLVKPTPVKIGPCVCKKSGEANTYIKRGRVCEKCQCKTEDGPCDVRENITKDDGPVITRWRCETGASVINEPKGSRF